MGNGLQQLETIEAQIATLLAEQVTFDNDAELHAFVIGMQRVRSQLGVAVADALAEWDARLVWAVDGSRSAAARLARDCHTSTKTAKRELCRARELKDLPVTKAAVVAGDLSLEHVDLLGRANTPARAALFAEHEALLVDQCTRLGFGEATRLVDYWCQRADAALGIEPDCRRAEKAHLSVSATLDGMVAIDGLLDPIGGSIFMQELRRLEHDLYLADKSAGTERTATQRRAVALVQMAERSAAMTADAIRPKPLFTVLVGDDTTRNLCELANGTVVHPKELVAWFDTAMLETVIFDGPSTVVSVSKRRTFTGAVRRAVEVRDRRCQHPSGCDEPASNCDVDHIKPASEGGVTSQFNGRLLCARHNRHANFRDQNPTPRPERDIHRLDELQVRIRWRVRRLYSDDEPEEPFLTDDDARDEPDAGDADTG